MTVPISPSDRLALVELVKAPEATWERIRIALEGAEPRLRTSDLADAVAAKAGIDAATLARYFRVFGAFYDWQANHKLSPHELLDEIRGLLRNAGKLDQLPAESHVRGFGEFLAGILALDNALGLSLKAYDVMTESERLFSHCRILTDFRQIFKQGEVSDPIAAVIVHSLRLTFSRRGTPFEEDIFLEMDSKDLVELKDAITRAQDKESKVRQRYEKTVPFLVK